MNEDNLALVIRKYTKMALKKLALAPKLNWLQLLASGID
jgi:hypothetical protein